MGYYAMLVPAYVGHVNPMTTLARALQRRGHRTVVLAPVDAEARIRKSGLEFIPIGTTEFPLGAWEEASAVGGKLTGLRAMISAVRCLARFARSIQNDLPNIIARERFGGMVMDQIAIGTEGVCEIARLPLAVACNSLPLHLEVGIPPMMFPWAYGPGLGPGLRNLLGYFVQNVSGWRVPKEVMPYRRRHGL